MKNSYQIHHQSFLALLSSVLVRRSAFLALGGIIVLLSIAVAHAQPCDMPLIVQESTVAPNILIVLDSSGSMRTIVHHQDFDDAITWTGDFQSTTTYSVSADGLYTPSSFDAGWALSPSVNLYTANTDGSGEYSGNYLNWLFFHATDLQRSQQPQGSRMQIGKAAVQALINSGNGMRYGLMIFNGDNGGKMLLAAGAPDSTVLLQVNGVTPDGWTPSAETLMTAMDYFKGDIAGFPSPIEYECQQNFIVFVTDGYPTQDLNIPAWIGDQDGDGNEPGTCESVNSPNANTANCSDYVDDVAYYLANNDMRTDMDGIQTVKTFTIGFGVDVPLMRDTARNGGGTYQFAWDLQSLYQSLGSVVGDIVQQISSGAAVAVVSTQTEGDGRLFRGKFMPGLWQGFLEAYELPYDTADTPLWEAGSLLSQRSASSRVLFTAQDGAMVDFSSSYVGELVDDLLPWFDPATADDDDDLDGWTLGMQAEADAAELMDWVAGEFVTGLRDRNGWKLGDLVNSTPLVIGAPAFYFGEPEYQQFILDNREREKMVYVGANDGMLHAFRASDGHELWGFVPEGVLGKLWDLTQLDYCHQSYVDLSPSAYDLKVNGSWRTVLFGGLRTGGDTYFALDVTDPYAPYLLWEKSVPAVGSSFTKPTLIHTENSSFLWVGSAPSNAGEAHVAVLEMSTGNLVATTQVSQAAGDMNLAGEAVALDRDFDGIDDVLYHNDFMGSVWRWDLDGDDPSSWYAVELFEGDQPIQARPTLAMDPLGNVLVYFGTGRFLTTTDSEDDLLQNFYCVVDDGQSSGLSRYDLTYQDGSTQHEDVGHGWYIDLAQSVGERVTQPASIVSGVVYFTSFAPTSGECSGGGQSWLYALNYLHGGVPEDEDTTGISDDDRITFLGDGIASQPVVSLMDASMLIQTSDARLIMEELVVARDPIQVQAWRQTFDDIAYSEPAQQ